MARQMRGLGKGLGEMLSGGELVSTRKPVQYVNDVASARSVKPGDVCMVNIDAIEPNPYQPRVTFDQQALEELAASIRTLGLIQPVTLRPGKNGKFQIISGERRFRASKMAGLSELPSYIRSTDDRGMLEMAIVENVQRADLDPIETAMSYQRLIDECSLTQEQMADRIGKSRVAVTNCLRLLKLPAKVQYELKAGRISVGHAKVLLGIDDKMEQETMCDAVIKGGLSVRALEQKLRSAGPKIPIVPIENIPELPDDYYKILEIIGKYFENNISLKRNSSGKGSMTIRFDGDGQIKAFLDALQNNHM